MHAVHRRLFDEASLCDATQAPVAFILSPLLTGGNPAAMAKLKV
jgi:hypothetical protein